MNPERPVSVLTPLVIKALGILLESQPRMNRIYCRTFFGERIISPPYISVNVPILLGVDQRRVLSALIVQQPQHKTVMEIAKEIQAARDAGISDKPITAFVARRSNTWYNRFLLRCLHGLIYRMPSIYIRRRAGGISLSSLIYEGKTAVPMTTVSFGPTAFTLALTSAWEEHGRLKLRVGVSFDHFAAGGELAIQFAKGLAAILSGADGETFRRLTFGVESPQFQDMPTC